MKLKRTNKMNFKPHDADNEKEDDDNNNDNDSNKFNIQYNPNINNRMNVQV